MTHEPIRGMLSLTNERTRKMSLALMVSAMSVKAGILELEQKKFEYQAVMIAACQWVDKELY